jgi:hypothetical protein
VCVCSAPNILISGKIIKEMPGSVASGTPCVYVSTNKDPQVFITAPTIHQAKKFLNDVASFHVLYLATQHCVAGNLLTAGYGLTEPNVVGIAARLRVDRAQCSRYSG